MKPLGALALSITFALMVGVDPARAVDPNAPKNVILVIGDGMGPAQVEAARLYLGQNLSFESAPVQAEMTTANASGDITDSAASATAMATGIKVASLIVSVRLPGDGANMETCLENLRAQGKSTGLVTSGLILDATPAAFGAHTVPRFDFPTIASWYLFGSRPNVLMGGGLPPMDDPLTEAALISAGYKVVTDRAEMQALNPLTDFFVAGIFGLGELPYEYDYAQGADLEYDTLPHLTEMVSTALSILEKNSKGFFLMVENENIDVSGHLPGTHPTKIERNVFETVQLSDTVQVILDWAVGHPDTLIIVTADHETGALQVLADNGPGNMPSVVFPSTEHTGVNMGVYAWGPDSDLVTSLSDPNGVIDNTDIRLIIAGPPTTTGPLPDPPPPVPVLPDGSLWILAGLLVLTGIYLARRNARRAGVA